MYKLNAYFIIEKENEREREREREREGGGRERAVDREPIMCIYLFLAKSFFGLFYRGYM